MRLILRAEDIDWNLFGGIRRLGITAGASAPEVLVEEIIDAFAERFAVDVETVSTADESVFFPLPRELREQAGGVGGGGLHGSHGRGTRRLPRHLRHRHGAVLQGHRRGRREHQLLPAHDERLLHPDALREAGAGGGPALLPRPDAASRGARSRTVRCRSTTAQGDPLGRVAGRPAAIITFLEGIAVRRPTAQHCGALGKALARLHLAGEDFRDDPAQCAVPRRLAAALRASRRASRLAWRAGLAERTRKELDFLAEVWPARTADGHHPCRSLHRQRVLHRPGGLRVDRLLLRLHGCLCVRPRDLPQRLVLRTRRLVQPHEGQGDDRAATNRCGGWRATRSRRCRCSAAARPCASC